MIRSNTSRRLTVVYATLLLVMVGSLPLFAQPCPNRTDLGSTVSVWDWRADQYRFELTTGDRQVASPFEITGNNLPPNVAYISLNQDGPDNDPDDGWELLYKNFGTAQNPVHTASFSLYNRYTGLVRTFFYLENDLQAFNLVSLDVNYSSGQEQFSQGAHILRYTSDVVDPLNEYEPNTTDGVQQYNILQRAGVWTVLDFPTAYDPCVCNSLSLVSFQPTLQAISEINLIIEGTGVSEAVYSASGSANSSDIATAARIAEGIFGGLKRYKDHADIEEKISLFSDFGWLPVVGGVLKTLDFFVNGKKTSPVLLGFNTDYQFEANGTEIFTLADSEVGILTPGAQAPSSSSNLQSLVPVYDNPIGVFGLLQRPIVEFTSDRLSEGEYYNCNEYDRDRVRYRFDASSIRYTINSAAGLKDKPKSIQAALRFSCEAGSPEFITLTPADYDGAFGLFVGSDNENELFTPLLNLECLEDYAVETTYEREQEWNTHWNECEIDETGLQCGDLQLILLVALEREDGGVDEEIVLSLTYDVDLREIDGPFTSIGTNPYIGMDVADINANCTTIPDGASEDEVSTFCDEVYDATLLITDKAYQSGSYDMSYLDNFVPQKVVVEGPVKPGTISEYIGISPDGVDLSVSPNPASKSVVIDPPKVATAGGTLALYSMSGDMVTSTKVQFGGPITVNIAALKPGTYLVRLMDNQGNDLGRSRLVVQ